MSRLDEFCRWRENIAFVENRATGEKRIHLICFEVRDSSFKILDMSIRASIFLIEFYDQCKFIHVCTYIFSYRCIEQLVEFTSNILFSEKLLISMIFRRYLKLVTELFELVMDNRLRYGKVNFCK